MSSAPGSIFTGSSQFSSDFQNVIQRAVQLRQLPIQQMQNDVGNLQSQSSELSTVGGDFAKLQLAVTALGNALGNGSYSASTVSSPSGTAVASVALSGSPGVGAYTVEVDAIGSKASALSDSAAAVRDPSLSSISDASAYKLSVGTATSVTIRPAGRTLSALAAAINVSGAGVQATVVNLGSSANPDYELSVQSTQLGAFSIQLTALDGSAAGQGLLSQQTPGAPTTYRVAGRPAAPADPLSSNSNTITLSPGVTATLMNAGSATITVTQNANAVSSALANFVSAYNTVQTEILSNRGQGKGALQGQSVLLSLSDAMRQIAKYSDGNSGISSLASLGVQYSSNHDGTLSFDNSVFTAATANRMPQLTAFLGSPDTGGFLQMATDTLNGITDPINGIIQSGVNARTDQVNAENQAIAEQQARLNAMQTNLTQQLASADTAISAMEQQYSYLYSMFQAMQANAQNGG